MYLLDTNVVSRLDPRRHGSARDLVAWIRRNGAHLWLSVITLTEIEADFGDRVLAVDAAVALAIARLAEAARPAVVEWKDLIIAATARAHGLTVLTNNLRHFGPTGVPALDPLARLPPDAAP